MYEEVNQPIKVGVKFHRGTAKPVWFVWRKRHYHIDKINMYHRSFRGEAPIHHYSVSVSRDCYTLTFDGKKLIWKLEKVWVE